MIEFISQPWPWYVAGPLIALVMFTLLYFGETFGVSSNLRTLCTISGAGKFSSFFRFDWRKDIWNLVVILGAVIGGFLSETFLSNGAPMELNPETVASLEAVGFSNVGEAFVPDELYSLTSLGSWQGWFFLVLGGFLVGFGARYAGGCTSGHAITGISNLQVPSVVAAAGFFIGGLIMTWLVFPFILG